MQVLAGTGPTKLTFTWLRDGTPTAGLAVTVGAVDADGTTILAVGTPTTDNGDGTYSVDLPIIAEVTEVTVTWTAGSESQQTLVEVVGGWLFTEPELRQLHGGDLSDTATFTDQQIHEARERITDAFEQICGVSFVPRWRRDRLQGSGSAKLVVARPRIGKILKADIGGTALDVSKLTPDPLLPVIWRSDGIWTAPSNGAPNVTVSYRHGHETPPDEIRRAALILARVTLLKDVTGAGIPEQASSWNDGTGQFVAFAANDQAGRWFGIPAVDTTLRRHRLTVGVG